VLLTHYFDRCSLPQIPVSRARSTFNRAGSLLSSEYQGFEWRNDGAA